MLIKRIVVYKDIVDFDHFVGEATFIEDTTIPVDNKIVILYGSNPIPPKHEARFRGKLVLAGDYLDEYFRLKPGTYIIEVETKDGTKVFYSIPFEKRSASMSILEYKYDTEYYEKLRVHLRIKNTGEIPIFIPDDVKVYLDGESWKVYSNEYVIPPRQTENVKIDIPLGLVPYNSTDKVIPPYFDIKSKQWISVSIGNAPSMFKSHKVTIVVANSKVDVTIPPLKMNGHIVDIKGKPRIDATGKVWVDLESIKLKVNYTWITTLDAGWFNRVTICVNNLCENFTPSKIDAKTINANEYIVELSGAGTYPAEKGNKVKVLVYYGDLLVAQADLT